MSDWSKAKARELIDRQIAVVGCSQAPDSEFGEGLIQMAFSLGLLTDTDLSELSTKLSATVLGRRRELRELQHQALLIKAKPVNTSDWPACNPACDSELGGSKSRLCMCGPAKATMAEQGVVS